MSQTLNETSPLTQSESSATGGSRQTHRTKVLLIDFSGYGVMTHVLSFLDQADHEKWEYTVLYATDDLRPGVDSYRAALAERKIHSFTVPVRQNIKPGDLAVLAKTIQIIKKVRPRLVHCHSSKAGAIGRPAARICNIPTVFTPHSFSFQLAPVGSRKRTVLTTIERSLGKMMYGMAAVSETERSLAVNERISSHDRVHLIPNGVDLAQCADAARHHDETRVRLNLTLDEPVVCFVGRLAPQKMPHVVVEAARALRTRNGESPVFLMIGNGPLEAEIDQQIADAGLQSRVRRLGWLPHDETLRILACSDVMVLPSRYEGLPYVALEAQAVRTVPILTKVPGSQDAVIENETGLFVPFDDPEALATEIWRVITDSELRLRLEDGGAKHIAEHYSSRQMARRIEALYTSALRGSA